MDDGRAEIPGSAPKRQPNESRSIALNGEEQVSATVILRRQASAAGLDEQLLSGHFQQISRAEAAEKIGADPNDAEAVKAFAEQYGLKVTSVNLEARSIKIEGPTANMDRAFGIELTWFEDAKGERYLSYEGPLTAPTALAGMILAVTGLDTRPVARAHALGMEPA